MAEKDLLAKARALRKNLTDVESLLWQALRNRRLNGYKFRRQVPVNRYIVDFMCNSIKLIIEIDGGQHLEQQNYDSVRTHYLESRGYKVLRYWNNDVLTNIEGILTSLTLALSQRERKLSE